MYEFSSLFGLAGKRVFVTGASSGIGLHLAKVFAQAGASVALGARREDRLRAAIEEFTAEGFHACSVPLDVKQPETIRAAWESAESALGGPIDVLLNNAGVLYAEKFVSQTLADVEHVFDTNLKGAFLVAQEATRSMAQRRCGSIINIASTAGLRAGGFLSSYGASKAGLIHLTKVMALELASRGVRVNALCPGTMRTDMLDTFSERGLDEKILERIPMRKLGETHELDGAALLLASNAGGYMTGVVLPVDGGQLLSWI